MEDREGRGADVPWGDVYDKVGWYTTAEEKEEEKDGVDEGAGAA